MRSVKRCQAAVSGRSMYILLLEDAARYGVHRANAISLLKLYFQVPGFKLSVGYRVARGLREAGFVTVSILISNYFQRITGCQISASAAIDGGLCIPHAIGIVIGEGVKIESGVTIYQHVTLGRKHRSIPGYPRVGRESVLYVGSCVFGDVVVGARAVVSAYSIVTRDVESGKVVRRDDN